MSRHLTLDDLKTWVETCPRDRRNAMDDDGECVYTNADGEHCIVGQFLSDMGVKLPEFGELLNLVSAEELAADPAYVDVLDDELVAVLNFLQGEADRVYPNCEADHVYPNSWGYPDWGCAIDETRAEGLL